MSDKKTTTNNFKDGMDSQKHEIREFFSWCKVSRLIVVLALSVFAAYTRVGSPIILGLGLILFIVALLCWIKGIYQEKELQRRGYTIGPIASCEPKDNELKLVEVKTGPERNIEFSVKIYLENKICLENIEKQSITFKKGSYSGMLRIERIFREHSDDILVMDILRFIWKIDDSIFEFIHRPELFFDQLSCEINSSIKLYENASKEIIELFEEHLLINSIEEGLDSRSYETLRISGKDYGIRIKYLEFKFHLAYNPAVSDKLAVLVYDLIDEEVDPVPPFIADIPVKAFFCKSTVEYDEEEKMWIGL